ncbi:hypothetical protein BC830DRAFT_811532 [Chytriomyces sp. MP71]|nr:hypothetical protein BC830DRAFT_811532 [Chytriomyces sp. MP71]
MDTTCVGVWFIQVCHISSHGVSQQYSLPVSCSCGVPPSFLFDHQMKAKKPRPSSGHHHAQPMKLKGEWTLLVASVAHVAANGDASATLAALVASLRQFAASESLLAFDAQTAALRSVAHALATLRSAKTLSSADAATLYRIIADVAIPVFCDAFFCAQEQAARTVLLSIYSRIIESDKVLMPLLEIDASYVPLSQLVKSDFESRLSAFLALTSTTSAATSATDYSDIGKCCSILLNTLEWSVGLAVVTSKLSPMISSLVTLLTRVKREIDVTGLNDDALLLSQKTRACYDILRTIAALFAKLGSSDISERNAAKEVFSFLEMDPAWKEAANQLLQDCIQITFSDPRIYVRDCQFMGGIVTCWLLETLFPAADSAWIQPVFFNGKLDTSSNAIQILTKVVRESIESPDRFHSLLCFIRGILTTLNTKILSISSTSDSNPLFPHLYSLIIQVIDTSSDAPTRILAFKTLASWMCVLRDAVKSEVPLPSQEFVMNAVLKQCFDFVFTFWEDPVDSMMHKLKDVFGFMLEIVKLLRDGKEADGDPASFLRDIVDSLLNADWLRKVKYDLLAHLLTVVSPYEILSLRADFLTLCFDAMNTVSISSRISAFLIRFFAALFDDTAVCLDHLQSAIWINPLCHALTHPSVALRSALSESFLSTVFSGKRTHFQLLLATLQSSNNPHISTAYHLHASICVLKIGKTLGFLPADFFLAPATREFSNHVVTIAITHPDANVRADVCGLLCDSNRALAEPTGEELTYMRQFLGANGADSVSEFRMKLFGGVHKLICRMRRCLYANERDLVQAMKRGNEAEAGSVRERIEMKSSFLRWLMEFAVSYRCRQARLFRASHRHWYS